MRILFVMRHAGYVRNFEWVLRLLAERGHRVHLGFERTNTMFPPPDRLETDTGGAVTNGAVPIRDDAWRPLLFRMRQSASYLRYLSPRYVEAERLRERWARVTPRPTRALTSLPGMRSRTGLRVLERVFGAAERRVPRCHVIEEHLRDGRYDLVLLTPLVDGPSQHDWLRSAKALGIPAVLAVTSWDNLTNKGVMFDSPDRTYVWNESQRREAIELHGLDPETVVAVGAHSFDHWFEWQPRASREKFCAEAGFDPGRPFLLYVCSSRFVCEDERPIVARWVEAVRADPELADVGILVRPHPQNGSIWADHTLGDASNAAVWPPAGANPTDDESRSAYFDSLHHSAAVVGMNTTALIEAAVVGRRTFSVLMPELHGTQEQTLHFHHLLPENGGALAVARSLEEHVGHLRECLSAVANDRWRRAFLESFVRPYGLEEPAAPRFVDDLERFAGGSVPAERRSQPAPNA